jgi:hypothetical protein
LAKEDFPATNSRLRMAGHPESFRGCRAGAHSVQAGEYHQFTNYSGLRHGRLGIPFQFITCRPAKEGEAKCLPSNQIRPLLQTCSTAFLRAKNPCRKNP